MKTLLILLIATPFVINTIYPFLSALVSWKSEIALAMINTGMLSQFAITAIFTTISFAGFFSIKKIFFD